MLPLIFSSLRRGMAEPSGELQRVFAVAGEKPEMDAPSKQAHTVKLLAEQWRGINGAVVSAVYPVKPRYAL